MFACDLNDGASIKKERKRPRMRCVEDLDMILERDIEMCFHEVEVMVADLNGGELWQCGA